jgi:hypothetical protein
MNADPADDGAPVADDGRVAEGPPTGAAFHELNNVLSAILGYAEIVHADAATGKVEERDALQILAATRRAIELVDDLAARLRAAPTGTAAIDATGSEPGPSA